MILASKLLNTRRGNSFRRRELSRFGKTGQRVAVLAKDQSLGFRYTHTLVR